MVQKYEEPYLRKFQTAGFRTKERNQLNPELSVIFSERNEHKAVSPASCSLPAASSVNGTVICLTLNQGRSGTQSIIKDK
jgi:hypothetical protein